MSAGKFSPVTQPPRNAGSPPVAQAFRHSPLNPQPTISLSVADRARVRARFWNLDFAPASFSVTQPSILSPPKTTPSGCLAPFSTV